MEPLVGKWLFARGSHRKGGTPIKISLQTLGLLGDRRRIQHSQCGRTATQRPRRIINGHIIAPCIGLLDILEPARTINLIGQCLPIAIPLIRDGSRPRGRDIKDGS